MDESTTGVTLISGFFFDVLGEYRGQPGTAPLFAMAAGLDPKKPSAPCAIRLYNNACSWIEENMGGESIRKAGRNIGNRIFGQMLEDRVIPPRATPSQVMGALKAAAETMITDPKKRGWALLEDSPGAIRIRRTQTFNCMLQEGLLLSLVERTGVPELKLAHTRCTRRGDEFCEYDLRWGADSAHEPRPG